MTPLHPTFRLLAVTIFALAVAYAGVRIVATIATHPVPSERGSRLTASRAISGAQAAKPDHIYPVAVPRENPVSVLSATEHTISQGEVVEFAVTTRRPGFVIVHGLSDPLPLNVAGTTLVSFRAIYSGRFALHFHGDDGAHFELTSLNVMPARDSDK
jgi:hypothetical protein